MFQKDNIFNKPESEINTEVEFLTKIEKFIFESLSKAYSSKKLNKVNSLIVKYFKECNLNKSKLGDKLNADIFNFSLNIYKYIINNDLKDKTLEEIITDYLSKEENTSIKSEYMVSVSKDRYINIRNIITANVRSEFLSCKNKARRVALYETYINDIKEAIVASNCRIVCDFLNAPGLKNYLFNNHNDFYKENVGKQYSIKDGDLEYIEEQANLGVSLKDISELLDMPYQTFLVLMRKKFPKDWYKNIVETKKRKQTEIARKILGDDLIEEIIKSPSDKYKILVKPENLDKVKQIVEQTGTFYISKLIKSTQSELVNFFKRKAPDWWENYRQ